jgi:hypothetical protein
VDFLADRAVASVEGGDPLELPFDAAGDPLVVPPGRLSLGLQPGARLLDLAITALLDPAWTRGRMAKLREAGR